MIATIVVVCIGGFAFFYTIGDLLSKSDQPHKVDVIICLSGDSGVLSRVKKTVTLLRHGYSQQSIFTHVISRKQALKYGIDPQSTLLTSKNAQTTFQEALYVTSLLQEHKFRTAMVISDPYHLYRVKWTFHHMGKELPVKFSFVGTDLHRKTKHWWQNRKDRNFVLKEIPKIIYYQGYHGLLGIDEDPKDTVELKSWYEEILWKMDKAIEEW